MELVKAIPITDYCDANKLSTRERLELFIPVCQAVQHAHQKGIIHRDLKPSNVLVTVQDDRPVPKVIDFGVAKATQARLTEKTLFTRLNQWIGTPAYMSPEQAGLGSLDVDTRSDVYSLGVLLYELLTGRTPFDTQKLMAAGYEAVMRVIREEEPPKPSTRLSTLAEEELSAVAAKRGAEPARLGRLVRGDLDWIVMKALEKDRQRRYDSATSLAADIECHLGGEAVLAAPPTIGYRLGRTIRRHSVFVGVASAIALLLAAGVVSTSLQVVRANRYATQLEKKQGELAENLYVSDMNMALHAWQQREYGLCDRTLRAHRPEPGSPDLRGFEWRYLWGLSHDARLDSWRAHANTVRSLAVAPDNSLLASTSHDGEGKLWDVRSKRCLATFAATDALLFSPAGDLCFAAGNRWQIDILSTQTWQKEWSINLEKPAVEDRLHTVLLAVSPTAPLLAFSPDASFFGGRGSVRLYDYRAREELGELENSGDRIAFSADGRTLVTGSADDQIHVWNVASRQRVRSLGPVGGVNSLSLSPDGRLLATTEFWRTDVRLWDLETGRELSPLAGHEAMVWQTAFSPDGRLLASSSTDQTIRLWDVRQRRLIKRLIAHASEIWALAFSHDGQRLFSGSKDLTISVWPTSFPPERPWAQVSDMNQSPLLFSRDGSLFAAGVYPDDLPRRLIVRETVTLDERASLPGERQALWFSPHDAELLTASTNDELHLWSLAPLEIRRRTPLPSHRNKVTTAAATPDGSSVAFLRQDQPGITVVEAKSGHIQAELPWSVADGQALVYSRDGRFLVGTGVRTIEVWLPQERRLAARLDAHRDGVGGITFSPDMSLMASVSVDNTAKLWRVADWTEVTTLSGHREGVKSGSFSPDGRTFATGCADGTIKFWHVGTGRELASIKHELAAWFLAFSPSGNVLACAPGSGDLWLLRVPSLEETTSRE
jgi:WD40 repeat protein